MNPMRCALSANLAGHAPTPRPALAGVRPVSVVDGDTIQVGGTIIQLFGIDAPELGQRCRHDGVWFGCGLDAAFELSKLIGIERTALRCAAAKGEGRDDVRICMAGHVDLAHVLLGSGYVVATPDAGPDYRDAESSARDAKLGLWHSEFVPRRIGGRAGGSPAIPIRWPVLVP